MSDESKRAERKRLERKTALLAHHHDQQVAAAVEMVRSGERTREIEAIAITIANASTDPSTLYQVTVAELGWIVAFAEIGLAATMLAASEAVQQDNSTEGE